MQIRRYFSPTRLWTVAFIASLVMLFIIGSISLRQIYALSHSQELVTKSHKIRIDLERLFSELKDAETAERGYLITKDFKYLEPSNYSHVRINKSLIALKDLTTGNARRQEQIEELNLLVNQRFRMLRDNVVAVNRFSTDSDFFRDLLVEERKVMHQTRILVDQIISEEEQILAIQEKKLDDENVLTPILSMLLVLFSVIIFLSAFLHINGNLRKVKKLNHSLLLMNEIFKDAERIGEISHWQLDLQNNLFWFSNNKYHLLGHAANRFEPTLANFLQLIHPGDRAKVRGSFQKAKNGLTYTVYYRIRRPDKKVRYIKTVNKLTHDSDGREILIGVDVDVTSQHRNTSKLERKNLELKSSNDELTAFNHIISHDLQEPLRKIQMFISRIDIDEFSKFSSNTQTYISRIQMSAQRAQKLISDLLVYSRMSKNDISPEMEDLNLLFRNAIENLELKIEVANATIRCENLPNVKVVASQMTQLFINLLSNSIKYRREDAVPKIEVTYSLVKSHQIREISVVPNKQYHAIQFSDNGIGFDLSYAHKIFEIFHRLHDNDKYSGTGIGLAICYKVAKNHQGYIYASACDKGATFTLLLPNKPI